MLFGKNENKQKEAGVRPFKKDLLGSIRIKHWLVNKRNQSRTIALANKLADVKVNDRFTADGHSLFLIYDKPGINRILVFCSLIGLIMLSKSLKWHADGIFHTKSKYFGQLKLYF